MDKNLHEIEKLFLKELEGNEEYPSQNVWDSIEKKLDKESVVSIKKKYDSLKKVSLLLVFLLTGLSIYIWKNQEKNPVATHVDILGSNKKAKADKDLLIVVTGTGSLQQTDGSLTTTFKNNNAKQLEAKSISKSEKDIDAFSLKEANNSNQTARSHHRIIDKAILKGNNTSPQKSLTPITSNNLSNTSIQDNKIKLNIPGASTLTEGLNSGASKFSMQKNGTLMRRKLDEVAEIKIPNRIEDKNTDIGSLTDIQFDHNLPAKETVSSKGVGIIKSNTVGLFDRKESLEKISVIRKNPLTGMDKNKVGKNAIKSANQAQLAITAFFSPDNVFQNFANKESGNSNNNNFDVPQNKSYAFTFGALVDYSFGKHWGVQSGITLARSDFELEYAEPETLYAQHDNSGSIQYKLASPLGDAYVKPSFSNNPNIGDSIFSKSTKYNLQYLGIPLAVKYVLNKGKFTFNVIAGLSANFLTRGGLITELESGNDNESETADKISGLKPFYFGGLAGIGLDYNIYKKFDLSFSPAFRFALNPINTNVSVASFPNSAGAVLGLKMKL